MSKRKLKPRMKFKGKKPIIILNDNRSRSYSLVQHKQEETQYEPQRCSKALIYSSEISFLGRCILDSPNIETGGQLFGFWTASGNPVVVYAIGPGPKANHQVTFFNQDVDYLERVGNVLVSKFGLMHIGEWHSHHQLGLDRPSGHDANTMQHSIDRLHLNRFLLYIGNCRGAQFSIKPYVFTENQSVFSSAEREIRGEQSPYRNQIDSYLSSMQTAFTTNNQLWFSDKSNRIQLKNMIDYMKAQPGAVDSKARLNGETVELVTSFSDRVETILFPDEFPNKPISIRVNYDNGREMVAQGGNVQYDTAGDLFEAFKQQYNSFTL